MKILIACEFSGRVRDAFRSRGHEAVSCDLLPCDGDSTFHLLGNCIPVISEGWDLVIMHPPCTALAVSGNAWYGKGRPKHSDRDIAIRWTMDLWELALANSPKVCMENPVGVLPIRPSQYIQPYEFGHAESKKTGLWLYGLPLLRSTNVLQKPKGTVWNNQTKSGQNKLGPSKDRWKLRSLTYQGIADAMAEQWG